MMINNQKECMDNQPRQGGRQGGRLDGVLKGFKDRGSEILNIFVPNELVANSVAMRAKAMGLGAKTKIAYAKGGAHWFLYGDDTPMHFVEVTQS